MASMADRKVELNEVYIHLGLHKTGSTFFQKRYFPIFNAYKSLRYDLPSFLEYVLHCNDLYFNDQEALFILRKELKVANHLSKKLIISDEQFSGAPWDNANDRKKIFDRLNLIFPDASYILVLREQEEMVKSLYLEYIKKGGSAKWYQFIGCKKNELSFSRGAYLDYYNYYNYVVQCTSEERILLLPYEWFCSEPRSFLEKIAQFIDEKQNVVPDNILSLHENKSIKGINAKLLRIVNGLFASDRQPFLLLPKKVHLLSRKWLRKLPQVDSVVIPEKDLKNFCLKYKARNKKLPINSVLEKYDY
ncbi:MAG: hypothetical protein ACQEUG_17820 [Pseudomonadota bacterium]